MIKEARLTINMDSLAHNYNTLRSKINPDTTLIAVVKANGYGNDGARIAQELSKLGATYFAVAYAKEGKILREAGIKNPLMVFYPQLEQLEQIIEYLLEPVLYNLEISNAFISLLKEKNIKNYPVHIKCNTGLNRIGFSLENLDSFFKKVNTPLIHIKSVYSHLGFSENPKPCAFTKKQFDTFELIKSRVKELCTSPPKFHILNSSGVFNYPEHQLDAVRIGIALYGFANNPEWNKSLRPIAKLSAPICQIHFIKKGESVGYNQGWIATKESRIGIIPLGHADGIGRQYGNSVGKVNVLGQTVTIIGNVCMDMLMIDLTSVDCPLGTEAIIFDQKFTASDFTASANTISYEILTSLSPRIQRVYI